MLNAGETPRLSTRPCAAAVVDDGSAKHNWQNVPCRLKVFVHGEDNSLRVLSVKDGLDPQEVATAVKQPVTALMKSMP